MWLDLGLRDAIDRVTTIIDRDKTQTHHVHKYPLHFHGIHGLFRVAYDDIVEYHLLEKGSREFVTHSILSRRELRDLHLLVRSMNQRTIVSHTNRVSKLSGFDDAAKSGRFYVEVLDRALASPIIEIFIKGKGLCFDAGWMSDLEKTLYIGEDE